AADLPRRRDPEPSHASLVGQEKDRAVTAVDSNTPLVHLLTFTAPADVFGWTESQSYSLLTVRRLRPFARRRFSTRRPFFVLMRTRNPCVLARWRLFGWNVRLPFIVHSGAPARWLFFFVFSASGARPPPVHLARRNGDEPTMLANGF